jgi:serine/threonine protein kinase
MGSMKQASDIWAFGCTLVHMLTGELPWAGRNYQALYHAVSAPSLL